MVTIKKEMLTISQDERYARQKILDGWDQEIIHNKTVLIAGMGSIGCFSAINFTLMGIGKLIIIDYDTIELSNLNRQLLFTEEDIGKFKVDSAKKNLQKLNPNVEIISINNDLKKVDRAVYSEADIFLDSLDTYDIRRWLNSMAVTMKKPMVHSGIYGWWGNVQVIIPNITACIECQPLIPKKRLIQYCTLPGEKRKNNVNPESEKKVPTISTTSMIIGGIQSQEALKILLGKYNSLLDNYLFYDGLSETFTYMKVQRNPECIVCSEKYKLSEVEFALSKQELIKEIMNRLILTYGFEDPKISFKTKILDPNVEISCYDILDGDIIYVIDKRISFPLKLKCKLV